MNDMKQNQSIWRQFWSDESGAILSAEAALLGTVGVVGAGAGLSAVSDSVTEEMKDVAFAIRSLDQSYSIPQTGCGCNGKAWTAGSSFTQQSVEVSHRELQGRIDEWEKGEVEDAPAKNVKPKPAPEAKKPEPAKKTNSELKAEAEKKKQAEARMKAEAEKQAEAKKKAEAMKKAAERKAAEKKAAEKKEWEKKKKKEADKKREDAKRKKQPARNGDEV